MLVAVLDRKKRLVGTKTKAKPGPDDIPLPENFDLPTTGVYKWENSQFIPLGTGYQKIRERAPVTDTRVIHMLVRATAGLPDEAYLWADWYERHILPHDAERDEKQQILRKVRG